MAVLLAETRFRGGDRHSGDQAVRGSTGRLFLPRRVAPVGAAFPSAPSAASRYPTAILRRATVVYDRPEGRPEARIPTRTEWGSPSVLSIVEQRGDWLGVLAAEVDNHEMGWLRAREVRIDAVSYALHVDLSRHELTVSHGGRTVMHVRVATGAARTPTPRGRYAVTDKLDVTEPGSPYGCCVIVLTAHQKKLPKDWPGGDRLAVHSTHATEALGHSVSLGCLRASFRDARWLMRRIPLGAPVFIRR
jgi:hypothetical protein